MQTSSILSAKFTIEIFFAPLTHPLQISVENSNFHPL